jgi:hypothetical protein
MSAKVWRTSSAVAYIVQRRGGGGGGEEVNGKEERRPAGLPSGAGAIKGIDFRKRKGGKLWRGNAALVLHYALMAGF